MQTVTPQRRALDPEAAEYGVVRFIDEAQSSDRLNGLINKVLLESGVQMVQPGTRPVVISDEDVAHH